MLANIVSWDDFQHQDPKIPQIGGHSTKINLVLVA
jgi:hypothetical protein